MRGVHVPKEIQAPIGGRVQSAPPRPALNTAVQAPARFQPRVTKRFDILFALSMIEKGERAY
jgi:hypothetical protein